MTYTPGSPVIMAGGGAGFVGRAVARRLAGGAPRGSGDLAVEFAALDDVA